MTRNGSPVRLVIALSLASTLAVFLLYTSLAGGAIRSLQPSQLTAHAGKVDLTGVVVGPIHGDPDQRGMRFDVRDITGAAAVPVLYRGSVPDLFRAGRDVLVQGRLRGRTFIADPGSLVTKCPSKYAPAGRR
jgi:cytochrome c-type biogenesis protein CcmE